MLARGVPFVQKPKWKVFHQGDGQVNNFITAAAAITAAHLVIPSPMHNNKKREYHPTPPARRDLVPSNFLGMHKNFLNLMDDMERNLTAPRMSDWGEVWDAGRGSDRTVMKSFSPKVDVSETEKDYRVHCEVPGIDPKDLKVEFKRGTLSIRGEKKMEKKEEDKDKKYYRVERASGKFFRSFRFENVEEKDISAKYKDGVLEIVVPKQHETPSGSIQINTEGDQSQQQQQREQSDQKDESSSAKQQSQQQQQQQQQRQQQQRDEQQSQQSQQSGYPEGPSTKKTSYA